MPIINPNLRLPDDSEDSHARMSFGDHIEELRKRLLYAVIGTALAFGLTLTFASEIIQFLVNPYRIALMARGYPDVFVYSKPADIVVNYISVGLQAGIILASPWIIYQLWLFVAAGLYQRERRIIYKYIGPSALLFLSGVAFFYYLVLPVSLNFFVGFTSGTAGETPKPSYIEKMIFPPDTTSGLNPATYPAGDAAPLLPIPIVSSDPTNPPPGQAYLFYNATEGKVKLRAGKQTLTMFVTHADSLFTNLPRFDEYLDFVTFMALLFGLAFEMPMVVMVLSQVGIVRPQTFRKIRKFAYFGIAILAAVATPTPDILTMASLAVPLIGLYELGIILAVFVTRDPPPDSPAPESP